MEACAEQVSDVEQAFWAPFFLLGEDPGWGQILHSAVRCWKGFHVKRCQDNGIDMVLFSFKLKILNIPEDSANDLQERVVRNFAEIFQGMEDR